MIYITHKHTKEKPRFRLVIPLLKNIESKKYEDVSKHIANIIGMKYFDKTTYCPSRLMHFPSTSIDEEYVFKLNDKPLLDPDTITINNLEDLKDNICNIEDINKKESPKLKLVIIGPFAEYITYMMQLKSFLRIYILKKM